MRFDTVVEVEEEEEEEEEVVASAADGAAVVRPSVRPSVRSHIRLRTSPRFLPLPSSSAYFFPVPPSPTRRLPRARGGPLSSAPGINNVYKQNRG